MFYKQSELKNLFNNKILGESKFPLFDSMFSVCVENVKKDYYFSEKLIDCFLCKSKPVYYGCDNISNYFNTDGMVLFHSIEELLSKTDILTPCIDDRNGTSGRPLMHPFQGGNLMTFLRYIRSEMEKNGGDGYELLRYLLAQNYVNSKDDASYVIRRVSLRKDA